MPTVLLWIMRAKLSICNGRRGKARAKAMGANEGHSRKRSRKELKGMSELLEVQVVSTGVVPGVYDLRLVLK